MRVFNDFSDLKGAVGTEVGVSDWMEITQDRINKFAEATGDEQWIHIDTERAARESPRRDHDRAGTALALADPDAHSGHHRVESREKHAELRRQQGSLSHSGPRRVAVTWPR